VLAYLRFLGDENRDLSSYLCLAGQPVPQVVLLPAQLAHLRVAGAVDDDQAFGARALSPAYAVDLRPHGHRGVQDRLPVLDLGHHPARKEGHLVGHVLRTSLGTDVCFGRTAAPGDARGRPRRPWSYPLIPGNRGGGRPGARTLPCPSPCCS